MKSHDIFISYSHKDHPVAELIANTLKKLGWSVWKDQRLTIGNNFTHEIHSAAASAKVLLVLWSASSVQSGWVKKEARLAIDHKNYFPIMIDRVELPDEFAQYHTSTLFNWSGDIHASDFGEICFQLGEKTATISAEAKKITDKAKKHRDFFKEAASPWDDLPNGIENKEDVPWPYWMIRYIVADTEAAMWDLIWSVGGSPPYGGVSYDEAAAVYELVERFRGPGKAPEINYANVERHIINKPIAFKAIEAFRFYDKVASKSETYTYQDLMIGKEEAIGVVEEPLSSYFKLLKAGLKYNEGKLEDAYHLASQTIDPLLTYAENDPVYTKRLSQALINTATFSTLNGDLVFARRCAAELKKLRLSQVLGDFETLLLDKPVYPPDLNALLTKAWEYFDSERPHYAIEWFIQAEKFAISQKLHHELPGILGDMAVCYRRMNNIQLSIRTYRRAIEAGQKANSTLDIYRWSQNLAGLLMRMKEYETAFPYLRISLYSAAILNEPNEIKLSSSALFEYKFHSYAPESDINDMFKTALQLVNKDVTNPKNQESIEVLTDYINGKVRLATM
jgi:tetratricopeptide (TPR) repeat protein